MLLYTHGMMFQFQTLGFHRCPKYVDDINCSYCQVKTSNLQKYMLDFL